MLCSSALTIGASAVATALAAVIECTTIDAARECERPGDGHLDRGAREFAEPAILGDRAQALGALSVPTALYRSR